MPGPRLANLSPVASTAGLAFVRRAFGHPAAEPQGGDVIRASLRFGGAQAPAADDQAVETTNASPAATESASTPVVEEKTGPNDFFDEAQLIDRALFAVAPNNYLADDSQPSVTIAGAISDPQQDWDFFSITLGEDERLTLDVDNAAANGLDAFLRVWDGVTGEQIAFNDDGDGFDFGSAGYPQDSFLRVTPGPGTYYFSIEPYAAASSGFYRIHVTVDRPTEAQLFAEDARAMLKGYAWNRTDLSYGFPSEASQYPSQFHELSSGFSGFTDMQQTATAEMLQMIANVSGLTFTENAAHPGEADLRFAMSSIPGSAHAYYPMNQGSWHPGGSAWFNTVPINSLDETTRYNEPLRGNHAWRGILHETGHTLGLKHTQDAPRVSPDHDSMEYSVMAYRSYVGQNLNISSKTNEAFGHPQSPMMLDIAALQLLYGPNFAHNATDSIYRWNPSTGEMSINGVGQGAVGDGSPQSNRIFLTVWDGGGTDTYDMSSYTSDALIDLRPGEWSITSKDQLAYLGDGHYARGTIANALLYQGDVRSLIENGVGGSGDDRLIGNLLANNLAAGAGADMLIGGEGADTLSGGAGADTFLFSAASDSTGAAPDRILGFETGTDLVDLLSLAPVSVSWTERVDASDGSSYSLVAVTLTGGGLSIRIDGVVKLSDFRIDNGGAFAGTPGADTLSAGAGHDLLDGGAGADRMHGLHGDDTYHVDDLGDVVVEAEDHGRDSVLASASWALGAGSEVETIAAADPLSTAALDLSGNGFDQRITGNAGVNILSGGGGTDTLDGSGGDDSYRIDADDKVIEAAGEGYDSVHVSASWALAAGVEVEALSAADPESTASLDLAGNEFDQLITGNDGANVLDGKAGADSLHGRGGDDVYHVDSGDSVAEQAGQGFDKVVARSSFTLAAGAEIEIMSAHEYGYWENRDLDLVGNEFAQQIFGNAGRNILNGGGGADVLAGGAGGDLYRIDGDDMVVEAAGQGTDAVWTTASYALPSGVAIEDLTAAFGTAAIDLTGNELVQTLWGNDGANRLDGRGGADTLHGGGGDDIYVVRGGEWIYEERGKGFDILYAAASFSLFSTTEIEILSAIDTEATDAINISGNETSQRLIGNAGANRLNGRDGDDMIEAGAGADTLDGGFGADILVGGSGDDVYVVDNLSDVVTEQSGAGRDEIRTGLTDFSLAGLVHFEGLTGLGDSGQSLTGNASDNRLDGGLGADAMTGGAGNDTYFVDDAGDSVTEAADEGHDEVVSSVSLALSPNVETLALTGSAQLNGTGNALDNLIQGNDGANGLDGWGGADRLDGGLGEDTLTGGEGDDVYVVDNAGDTVAEVAGEGMDSVESSVDFALPAEVERLFLLVGAVNGIGNALANALFGNDAANRLSGGGGADRMAGGKGDDLYIVDASADQVVELSGEGVDAVRSSVGFVLPDQVEHLTLTGGGDVQATGNALANSLIGNNGNNRLDGKGGADTIAGGTGHDVYVVDHVGDRVIEAGSSGNDSVESAVTYALPVHFEKLIVTGNYGYDGRGNAAANRMIGNKGANFLNGGRGDDIIDGGAGGDWLMGHFGNDRLTGGTGSDRFYFNVAPGAGNADEILDFSAADDSLYLLRSVFTRAGAGGTLAPGAFHQGANAADTGDRILYDAATGDIFYDADGTGAAAPMLFASVAPGTALSHADFVIYG